MREWQSCAKRSMNRAVCLVKLAGNDLMAERRWQWAIFVSQHPIALSSSIRVPEIWQNGLEIATVQPRKLTALHICAPTQLSALPAQSAQWLLAPSNRWPRFSAVVTCDVQSWMRPCASAPSSSRWLQPAPPNSLVRTPHGFVAKIRLGQRGARRSGNLNRMKPALQKYRTTNWNTYNEALKSRSSLLIWLNPAMNWHGQPSGERGLSQAFSDEAI